MLRSIKTLGYGIVAATLVLALGGCGVFCSGVGTNGWAGGACGTTVHF